MATGIFTSSPSGTHRPCVSKSLLFNVLQLHLNHQKTTRLRGGACSCTHATSNAAKNCMCYTTDTFIAVMKTREPGGQNKGGKYAAQVVVCEDKIKQIAHQWAIFWARVYCLIVKSQEMHKIYLTSGLKWQFGSANPLRNICFTFQKVCAEQLRSRNCLLQKAWSPNQYDF